MTKPVIFDFLRLHPFVRKSNLLFENKGFSSKIQFRRNQPIRNVIASETKQSRMFNEIATHLLGARNDRCVNACFFIAGLKFKFNPWGLEKR
jgi:hypothetical protein